MNATNCRPCAGRFRLTMVFLAVIGALAYWSAHRYVDTGSFIAQRYQTLEKLDAIVNLLHDDESALRGYLLTRNKDYLDASVEARTKLAKAQDALRDLIWNAGTMDKVYLNEVTKAENDKQDARRQELDALTVKLPGSHERNP